MQKRITRRALLRDAIAASAGVTVAPFVLRASSITVKAQPAGTGTSADDPLDVVIIGGGVSGVYAAWRLITADPSRSEVLRQMAAARGGKPLKIRMFEQSDRIGGRLWSVLLPGMPAELPADVGGMRFLKEQPHVFNLVKHLGLEIVPFPFGDPNNIQYLRRRQFRLRDYTRRPSVVPYDLRPAERGKDPGTLLTWAIEQIAPEVKRLTTPAQWEAFKRTERFQGRYLYEWGFWNLISTILSIEGYNFVRDANGYYTVINNWNAAEAMEEVVGDFPGTPHYLKLKYGYQRLPEALARRFINGGGTISLEHRVSGFRAVREGGRTLIRFTASRKDGVEAVHYARHVVLAMPKRALELILPESPLLAGSSRFRADLSTVSGQPGSKLFLAYETAWWRRPPINITIGGRSDTDLPLRQCYYWGAQYPGTREPNPALLMASYSDGDAVDYWAGFLPESRRAALETSTAMVEEAQRQLREMHAPGRVPEAKAAVFRDWQTDPYGAGWHWWNPFVRSWEIMPRIQHPVPETNCYICGEAYSTNQGWVEGALQTAEDVLTRHFRLPPPSWLKR